MVAIAGNVTESLAITDWRVTATKCKDGSLSGTTTINGTTYSVTCLDTDPVNLTLAPKIDYRWTPGKSVLANDFIVASNPDTLPHIWKATSVTGGDQYYTSVFFLLNCNGSNASTVFTDTSQSPVTVTANGNAQIGTAQSKWGGSSLSLDGSGDYLTLPVNINIRTGVWTLECWSYLTNILNATFFADQDLFYLEILNGTLYLGDGSTNPIATASHGLVANTWQHIELVSTGSGYYFFVDGVLKASTTSLMTNRAITTLYIGGRVSQGLYSAGYMDDIRGTAVARHTAGFTPPTSELTAGPHTGSTEPTWNLSGTTSDNGITWTYVAPLVDPVTIGPKIPA